MAVGLSSACGDDSSGETLTATRTPGGNTLTPTSGDIVLRTSGHLDDLSVSEAAVGDEIKLTGSEWTNVAGARVRFYLLTKEQTEQTFNPADAVILGDATPSEDGAVSFKVRLAGSYETENGDRVEIEAGQRWHVGAFQRTEPAAGLEGSHGSFVGPLTVK